MLNIVGDINYSDGYFDNGFGVGSAIRQGADPFVKLPRCEKDLWIGNFEGVTSDNSKKRGLGSKQFNINPSFLIDINHLDFYSIANNHSMEHGPDAFNQTLKNLTAFGSSYFGLANNPSVEFNHQNHNISITGFSLRHDLLNSKPLYWYRPDYSDIKKEYDRVASNDFKIVYIHWGNEFINRPNFEQRLLARYLVDIGFDLVIGMHPHLLQGFEKYKEKYIFYSIGNCVFNMPWNPLHYGAIVKINFEKPLPDISYDYIYIGKNFFPSIINEELVPLTFRFDYLNELVEMEENNEQYYKEANMYYNKYRLRNYKYILTNIFTFKYKFQDAFVIIKDFLKRKIKY
ncbi:MAG: CapA family protein [Cytophagia bacterium]|jgi:hypothetical protein|nr:CapA family protein [Cytophagia bacterium]